MATNPLPAETKSEARQRIINAYWAYEEQHRQPGETRVVCQIRFCEEYQQQRIWVHPTIYLLIKKFKRAALNDWMKKLNDSGQRGLQDRYGNRKGQARIAPDVQEFCLALVAQYPHIAHVQVRDAIQARFITELLPSQSTLNRWLKRWKRDNASTYLELQDPDQWKGQHMVAFGSYSENITQLNERWELDSTPGDILLADGRYNLIGCIDVYTRRLKLLVVPTSKASHIASLLRRCLLEWGVPQTLKTDNGKDYTALHIDQIVHDLNIEHKLCKPFCPWEKPHIERGFKTFSHNLFELLPGFAGHNVAERQALRARQSFADRLLKRGGELNLHKLTAAQLQDFCDRWCATQLHQPHKGLDGSTPYERITQSTTTIQTIANERALDLLLIKTFSRVVQKKGIQDQKLWYIAPELEPKTSVFVRRDPQDMGRLYVFDAETEDYLCTAECPEVTGIDRAAVAAQAKAHQNERRREAKRQLQVAGQKHDVRDIAYEIIRDREQRAEKVVRLFPTPETTYASGGLSVAVDAVEQLETEAQRFQAPEPPPQVKPTPVLIRDSAYYQDVWEKHHSGQAIAPEELQKMQRFLRDTPEGKALLPMLASDFDLTAEAVLVELQAAG